MVKPKTKKYWIVVHGPVTFNIKSFDNKYEVLSFIKQYNLTESRYIYIIEGERLGFDKFIKKQTEKKKGTDIE